MCMSQHSLSFCMLPDECYLFCPSFNMIGTLFKAGCSPFEVSSPEVNSRVLTVSRQPWGNIDAFLRVQPLKDPPMLLDPFERFLWWSPGEKLYPTLRLTALHYTPALAPYHTQSSFFDLQWPLPAAWRDRWCLQSPSRVGAHIWHSAAP